MAQQRSLKGGGAASWAIPTSMFFLYRLEHGQVTLHCAQPGAEAAWPCTRPWLKREGKMDAATQLDVGALQGRALRDRGTCHGWIAIWLRIIVVHPVCASSHT